MPVPKTDALPLGYTPYGLVWTVERGEGEKGEAGLEERAVQERGDIARLQGFRERTFPLFCKVGLLITN